MLFLYLVSMYGFDYQLLYNNVMAYVFHIIVRSVDFPFAENLRMFQAQPYNNWLEEEKQARYPIEYKLFRNLKRLKNSENMKLLGNYLTVRFKLRLQCLTQRMNWCIEDVSMPSLPPGNKKRG